MVNEARWRSLILISTVGFFSINAATGFQFCPNNGEPKLTSAGKPVQCLPGQPSEGVCGNGYACFFSGSNYQCCPTNDDTSRQAQSECPKDTVAVLDSDGRPIRCSLLSQECPQSSVCENSVEPICCQSLTNQALPVIGYPSSKPEETPETGELFNSNRELSEPQVSATTSHPDVNSMECPGQSLMVLTDEGNPTLCNQDSKCSQKGMFCHGESQKICCESLNFAVKAETKSNASTTISPQTEPATEFSVSTTAESTATTQTHDPAALTTTQQLIEVAYKTEPIKTSGFPTKQVSSKALGSKNSEYQKPVKFGYAASRPFDPKNGNNQVDKKEIVQHYLLEQIKQGWPYNEKFYRPENIAMVREGSNPSAVVHFP